MKFGKCMGTPWGVIGGLLYEFHEVYERPVYVY